MYDIVSWFYFCSRNWQYFTVIHVLEYRIDRSTVIVFIALETYISIRNCVLSSDSIWLFETRYHKIIFLKRQIQILCCKRTKSYVGNFGISCLRHAASIVYEYNLWVSRSTDRTHESFFPSYNNITCVFALRENVRRTGSRPYCLLEFFRFGRRRNDNLLINECSMNYSIGHKSIRSGVRLYHTDAYRNRKGNRWHSTVEFQ